MAALLLISSLFLHASCRLGVLAWFYLNRSYIAAELCINRFEPASDCAGSCQLDNTLAQLDHEQESLPDYLLQVQEILLYYRDSTSFTLTRYPQPGTPRQYSCASIMMDNRNSEDIFKPPRLSAFSLLA